MSKKQIKETQKEVSKEKEKVLTNDTRIKALLQSRKRIIKEQAKQIERLLKNPLYGIYLWYLERRRKNHGIKTNV